jgi:hypothetical protein
MGQNGIELGDRVINLQVPGIFTVIDRVGALLVLQTERGLRMTVAEQQVRRVDEPDTAGES